MNQENRCPQCGAELAADAPQGLCPACLLKRGLESQTTGAAPTGPDTATGAPPTPAELAPLFPDLEILELVGRGGMGVVYKARQKRLDRLVALKILSPSVGKDPAFADRFAREARAMAMLGHPHIVAVYDFGQRVSPLPREEGQTEGKMPSQGGTFLSPSEGRDSADSRALHKLRDVPPERGSLYYFLMEYIDGLNLRQLLDAGKLAPKEALAIVPQICEALQYAHDKGVVHRDIKPENVLVAKDGQVKIADFGLAKLMGREAKDFTLTGAGQVMGTPNYMAPEQIEHPQEVDHRADIYSLGVVFYQMLTGELPIGRFSPPSAKVQVDVRLDEVVLRALEKEPERRYQQASQIKTEVEGIVTTPRTGGDGRQQTSAADGWLWAPWQSPLIKDSIAHMTGSEKRDALMRAALFGVWNAATCFGPVFCIQWLPSPSNWIFAGLVLITGLSFYPLFRKFDREFLASTKWARQQSITPDMLRPRKSWLLKLAVSVVVALLFLVAIRAYFCEAFVVPSDSASPELTSGSRILAWKMTKTFAPRDLIVYRFKGHNNVGRVVRNEGADLIVNRNGQPDFHVSRDAVIGKVICVYWRASASEPARSSGLPTARAAAAGDERAVQSARSVVSSASETPSTSPAADLKALQGLWGVVQCKAPKDASRWWPAGVMPTKFDRVYFAPDFVEFVCTQDGSSERKDYFIDPTATPKTLDLMDPVHYSYDQSGRLLNAPKSERDRLIALGIYELEGGRLTIRLAEYMRSVKGDQRPTSIPIEPGSEDLLLALERYQPTGDEKAIQDDWAVVSLVEDGKVIAEEKFRKTRFSFSYEYGNEFNILNIDNPHVDQSGMISSLYYGRFALNSASRPKSITLFNQLITLTGNSLETVPETLRGIYKFDGGRLTIAFRKGDAPPEKFESKPGSGVTLLVLERSQPAAVAADKKSIPGASANVAGGGPNEKGLQKAQAERIKTLQKAFEVVDAQYRVATATPQERAAALDAVLEAQLEAATTKAERIAILEKLLDSRREVEKIVTAQFMNGLCSEADVDKAKAETLGDEIRLAKEKSAASVENSTPPRNREAEENIRKLQDERIVSLAKTFVIIDAQYSVARAEFGQRIAASDALLQAQLDVAESKLAQIAVLQKLLQNRLDAEKYAESQFKSGTGSEADYLRAKAKREAAESSVATENAATSPDDSAAKPVDPNNPRGPTLLYWAQGALPKDTTSAELMDKLLAAVDRRLNAGAEKLARVRALDNRWIEVTVLRPDDTDLQRVKRLLSRPGTLEVRILATPRKDEKVIEQAKKSRSIRDVHDGTGKRLAWWVPVKESEEKSLTLSTDVVSRKVTRNGRQVVEVLVVDDQNGVTNAYITKAAVGADNNGPCVNFILNEAGGKLLAKLTGDHLPDRSGKVNYLLGIIVDGEVVSAPSIKSAISTKGKIDGRFTKEQAADLADALNAGPLPAHLRLVP